MKRHIKTSLKLLIALVVAAALTKIAFFSSGQDLATADITPGHQVTTQTTSITTGDITNSVDVSDQIVEDAAVDAKATANGTVDSLSVAEGQAVTAGEPLLSIKTVENQPSQQDSTGDSGSSGSSENGDSSGGGAAPEPKVTWSTVYAPVAGTVKYQVIANQEVTTGSVIATVSPGTYSATGKITPAQQYRLTNAPKEAKVTVAGGPASFTCSDLKIGTKQNKSTSTDSEGNTTTSNQDGTSVEVRCTVPSEQTVFPGLTATIGIDGGSAQGTLLAPVTAVEGSVGTGYVWVVSDPQSPEKAAKTEVKLGLTDGSNIQITEGVEDGAEILQFVPGKDVKRKGTPNTCESDGTTCYDENGEESL